MEHWNHRKLSRSRISSGNPGDHRNPANIPENSRDHWILVTIHLQSPLRRSILEYIYFHRSGITFHKVSCLIFIINEFQPNILQIIREKVLPFLPINCEYYNQFFFLINDRISFSKLNYEIEQYSARFLLLLFIQQILFNRTMLYCSDLYLYINIKYSR